MSHILSHMRISTALVLALTLSAFSALGQSLQYRTLDVAGRMLITVPAHWHVRDLSERLNIATAADAARYSAAEATAETMHVSSLSVVSTSEKPTAILRASVVKEPGTQEELRKFLSRGKKAAIGELAATWKEQVPEMTSTSLRLGGKYLGEERFDYVEIDGKLAMVISYKRASLTGGAPFRVTQYHVPLGVDKLLITLSVQDTSSQLMTPILERVRSSIRILR